VDVFSQIAQWLISSQYLWPAVAILAAGSVYLILNWFVSLYKLFDRVQSLLQQDHGNPEVHYMLLNDIKSGIKENKVELEKVEDILEGHIPLCNEHFQDIDKIADKTLFDRCPIDNCPAFQKVALGYKDLQARLELFEVMAAEARKRTADNLDKMTSEMLTLSAEMVKTLRREKMS
jgi:hypothetical protein